MKQEYSDVTMKIRTIRREKGMSQEDLAKASGIALSTIKKYEVGNRNPKPDQLAKIAAGLGVSLSTFIDLGINNVADVVTLLLKIDESTALNWECDYDPDGNIIPGTIKISFSDPNINKNLASIMKEKNEQEKVDYTVNLSTDDMLIEITKKK